jgi:hypothetical protein
MRNWRFDKNNYGEIITMTAENQNIVMFAGDDMDVVVEVKDDRGIPIDLRDAQDIRYAVRVNADSTNPTILLKTLEDGISVMEDESSHFKITITAQDSAPMKGRYFHIARVTNAEGKRSTVMVGSLIVRENGFPDQ